MSPVVHRPVRPGQITQAVRGLFPGVRPVSTSGGPAEFTVAMPQPAAWTWGVHDPVMAWRAGETLTRILGREVHVAGVVTAGRRGGGRTALVTVLDAGALRAIAQAELTSAGVKRADARTVLDEARKFPGRYAYTPDRRRCAVFAAYTASPATSMRWGVFDCEDTERRIKAAGLAARHGWTRVPR